MSQDQQPLYSVESIKHNTQVIHYARSCVAAVAGLTAGILGLQGWVHGLLFYVLTSIILSLILFLFHTRQQPHLYFSSGAKGVWMEDVAGHVLSYLLFWTLANGLVYVYD